jgi:hypothetical protein
MAIRNSRPRPAFLKAMPKIHETWTVLPHGPLTTLDDGILTVTGDIHMPLVDLERRMTVVRLKGGSTVIYSAIALDEAGMKQIEALGMPRWLVVPGDAHRLDAKTFKQRYPQLQVIAPEGARARIEEAVQVDAVNVDFGDPDVTLRTVAGTGGHEAALLVRRGRGATLILSDLIGNLRRKGGFEGWLLHVMGFGSDRPGIPTVEKLLMVRNKADLRQQMLDWAAIPDLRRILVSHGAPIEIGPASVLRELAATLT